MKRDLKIKDDEGQWIDWIPSDQVIPQAVEIKLVLVRREMVSRLNHASDWDGGTAAGSALDPATDAGRNKNLEVYQTTFRFGNHEM
ncbi:MAG: hypothetical protein HC845_01010 [Akkermansiaceae bacterium]|nr:hypothetical protein [Akkermansiaceae bacterium]